MLHKTLKSYHDNDPYHRDDEDHPDGPLWLLTLEEFIELQDGFPLIRVDGRVVVKGKNKIRRKPIISGKDAMYMGVGIRGVKDD